MYGAKGANCGGKWSAALRLCCASAGSFALKSEKKSSSQHQLAPATYHLKPDLDASAEAVEISFLSTARAGTIIVGEDELQRAIDALEAEKVQDESAEEVPDSSEVGLGLDTDTVEPEPV